MKNTYLIFGFISFFTIQQNYGQIKINSSGKVGVAGYEPNTYHSIRGEKAYFRYDNSYSASTEFSYVYESVGIGQSASTNYSLRIYPGQNVVNALRISDGFNRTSGATLYVDGDAVITGGVSSTSDRRLKKDEDTINSKQLFRKLSKIRGKKFKYKSRKELLAMHNSGQVKFPTDTIYKKMKVLNENGGDSIKIVTEEIKNIRVNTPKFKKGKHYGVMAQDVIEEYPDLVILDESSGVYSVNYTGFIPLLLEGVNLQQEEISKMSKQIDRLKARIKALETN